MTLQIALCSRQSTVDEVAESLNFAIRQKLLVVTIQCQTFDRLRPRVSVFYLLQGGYLLPGVCLFVC